MRWRTGIADEPHTAGHFRDDSYRQHNGPTNSVRTPNDEMQACWDIGSISLITGFEMVKEKVTKMLKVHSAINTKSYSGTWKTEPNRQIETIISTDLLQLLVLLCSVIRQQYTLQCTIRRDSSASLPLPPDQHHISDVAIRRLGGLPDENCSPHMRAYTCTRISIN